MHVFWNHIYDWLTGLVLISPPLVWPLMHEYEVLLGILLISGIALLFIKKLNPGLRERLLSFCWNNFILGLLLFFLRYQDIPLIGMDLWRFLQEVAMVIWLIIIFRYGFTRVAQDSIAEQVAAHKNKYLPKAKKS